MPRRRLKVRFYRAEPRRVHDEPWPNDLFPLDEFIDAVTKRAPTDDRYVDVGANSVMATLGTRAPAYMPWSLYRVRRDELPDEEQDGAISQLVLPDTSNLAEGAHIVVFRRNIVGVCRRQESPGRGDICGYAEAVLRGHRRSVLLTPIVRPDVMSLLTHAELVAATIKVTAGNAPALARVNQTLGGAARNLSRASSATTVAITVGAGRTVQDRRNFRRDVLGMLRPVKNEVSERLEKLEVEYISEDAGRQVIDLLGDDISVSAEVDVDAARRGVPPEQAYRAIRDAYSEALEQINVAIQLG
jgi:hypothetical protein